MTRRIFLSTLLALLCVSSLAAATSPTPTPTPRKSFLGIRPNVNPSATPSKSGAALARGAHLGPERTPYPSATPQSTPRSTSKHGASPAKKSPTPSPSKPAKSATPSETPSPKSEKSPTPKPSATASVPAQTPAPSPSATPVESPSASPTPPAKLEVTLTKFEPPHGAPGDADYRSARLSYRMNVPSKMDFPVITFTVESANGKLFTRRFALPKGSASIEPNDMTERTVALDPEMRDDWKDAFAKTDNAKFSWAVEGQGNGEIEKPVKKSWP